MWGSGYAGLGCRRIHNARPAAINTHHVPQRPIALAAAASNGKSSAPADGAPRTPSVTAAVPTKTIAALPRPTTIANGIDRFGSLTSPAMIAGRMKPSHVKKNAAASPSTPLTLFPKIGVRLEV